MSINVGQSTVTVVYALKGRAAEEIVARFTRLLRSGKQDVRISLADKFVYLGVRCRVIRLRCSPQCRGLTANQIFGSLKNVL